MEFVGGGREWILQQWWHSTTCLAVDYLVLAVLCIPTQRAAISHNQESEWSGHRRVERQGGHCHLVISRHTAIYTSYFSPGLANWTITRDCVVRREEEIEDFNKLIKLQLLELFLTTDWLLFHLKSMRFDVWQRVSGQDVSEQWAARRRAEVRRGGGRGDAVLVIAGCCWLLLVAGPV